MLPESSQIYTLDDGWQTLAAVYRKFLRNELVQVVTRSRVETSLHFRPMAYAKRAYVDLAWQVHTPVVSFCAAHDTRFPGLDAQQVLRVERVDAWCDISMGSFMGTAGLVEGDATRSLYTFHIDNWQAGSRDEPFVGVSVGRKQSADEADDIWVLVRFAGSADGDCPVTQDERDVASIWICAGREG